MHGDGNDLPESFYRPLGDGAYEPTWATESPWDTGAQHGGPPSALLGYLMRTHDPVPGLRLAKVTVEFLGQVPRTTLTTDARVVRPGRRVRMLEASLSADGKPVALARGWEIAVTDTRVPDQDPAPVSGAGVTVPDPQPQRYFPGFGRWGYGESIEWRWMYGALGEPGPGAVWTRPRLPLVAGEPLVPLDRALLVADSANGISATLPVDRWLFVPTSVTVVVHRHPAGEWVSLEARTTLGGDGHGSTTGTLGDTEGTLGTISQPLLVAPR